MRPASITALFVTISLAGHAEVYAWSPQTRMRMVDEAVQLMPPSLRLALEHHRETLMRGVLLPMTGEDGPQHRPPWDGGRLDQEIANRIDDLALAAADLKSFADLARRFGELAHFVADASFPPAAAGQGGSARYQDFGRYCESRLGRIPLVFYGHDDPDLKRDDYPAFALGVMKQARAEDQNLARAYAMAGDPPDPAAFDDRSVPFAVASLSYSRSVTHVVQAWLAAWGKSNGDLKQTPYLKSAREYRH